MKVRHSVLLRFQSDTPKEWIAQKAAELRALPERIPNILSYEVGMDLGLQDGNYHLSIAALFPHKKAYLNYANHEEHLAVVSRIKPRLLMPGGRTAAQFYLSGPTSILKRPKDMPLCLLFAYFIFSCMCIESKYCFGEGPMDPSDDRFMMKETYAFSREYNPLFLARPEWLRLATCFSAFGFLPFHLMLLAAFLFGINRLRPIAFIFAGCKLYALVFYHTMEYLSDTPPPNFASLGPYWYAEGPYLVALVATLWRMRCAEPFTTPGGSVETPDGLLIAKKKN